MTTLLEEKAAVLYEAYRALGMEHARSRFADVCSGAKEWEARAIRDLFQQKVRDGAKVSP